MTTIASGEVCTIGDLAECDMPPQVVGSPSIQIRRYDGSVITIIGLTCAECVAASGLFMEPVRLCLQPA